MTYFVFKKISIGYPELQPFTIGMWCGNGKPNDVNEYLRRLVENINDVIKNGIVINGYLLEATIRCFLGDSPARSFLKGHFYFYIKNFC